MELQRIVLLKILYTFYSNAKKYKIVQIIDVLNSKYILNNIYVYYYTTPCISSTQVINLIFMYHCKSVNVISSIII